MNALSKLATVRRMMLHYADAYDAPPLRQVQEMLQLWARNGIGPLEYYLLGLFRPAVPWEEKLKMVSVRWFWKKIQIVNPPHLRAIATDKIVSYGMLKTFGVRTPFIHGVLSPVGGRTTDGEPLTNAAELDTLIRSRSLGEVCLKPLSGWSGHGVSRVLFVRYDERIVAHVQPEGPDLSLQELCDEFLAGRSDGRMLIQDAVVQHPMISEIHPSSLNTMRIWMYQPEPGRWEMMAANLRIGVGGSVIDNTSAGGIGAVIDHDTGVLGPAVLRGLDPASGVLHQEYSVHPTTGVQIEGLTIPLWNEVREVCQRACSVFPFFGLMGLDIGLGPEHPWVIEVEADPHAMIQVYTGRGIRPYMDELLARTRREA